MSVKGFSNDHIKQLVRDVNDPMVKQYFEYDSEADVVSIYRVQAGAVNNEACLQQRLEYATVSGSKFIRKIDWINANWSSAWDI